MPWSLGRIAVGWDASHMLVEVENTFRQGSRTKPIHIESTCTIHSSREQQMDGASGEVSRRKCQKGSLESYMPGRGLVLNSENTEAIWGRKVGSGLTECMKDFNLLLSTEDPAGTKSWKKSGTRFPFENVSLFELFSRINEASCALSHRSHLPGARTHCRQSQIKAI